MIHCFPLLFSTPEGDSWHVTLIKKMSLRTATAALFPLCILSLLLAQPLVAAPSDAAKQNSTDGVAVAKPVNPEPVQIFGWSEYITVNGVAAKFRAKLDTGATTSSIHAEKVEMFERDGKKWVRFVLTDPTAEKPVKTRVEAPLARIVKIKEPGGVSAPREVVKLGFQIGERKMRGEFTLNNRSNMTSPILSGRNLLKPEITHCR